MVIKTNKQTKHKNIAHRVSSTCFQILYLLWNFVRVYNHSKPLFPLLKSVLTQLISEYWLYLLNVNKIYINVYL